MVISVCRNENFFFAKATLKKYEACCSFLLTFHVPWKAHNPEKSVFLQHVAMFK